MLDGTVSQ